MIRMLPIFISPGMPFVFTIRTPRLASMSTQRTPTTNPLLRNYDAKFALHSVTKSICFANVRTLVRRPATVPEAGRRQRS